MTIGSSIGSPRVVRLVVVLALLLVGVVTGENEGMAVWADVNQNPPGYALWNGSAFSPSHDIGEIDNGDWLLVRGAYSPIRDEAIVVGITGARAETNHTVTAYMYSGGQWSSLPFSPLEDHRGTAYPYRLGFDVSYESQSGNPLIVWHVKREGRIRYASWTGSEWRYGIVPTPGGRRDFDEHELNLEASPKSNEMVIVVGIRYSPIDYAIVWDGDSWGNAIDFDNTGQHRMLNPNVAFEHQSGRAIVVYADGSTSLKYQIWDGITWRGEGSVSAPAGIQEEQGVLRIAMGAAPSTNRIIVAVTTYGSYAFWVTVWNGNQNSWGSTTLVASTAPSQALNYHSIAVAFEGNSQNALATYAQSSGVKYRTWSSSSGWSEEEQVPDLGGDPDSMLLFAKVASNDIMLAIETSARNVNFCKWGDAGWGEVMQIATNAGNGVAGAARQPFFFMWKPVAAATTEASTPSPTKNENHEATDVTKTTIAAGHQCENNDECESNTCRNGVCMTSSACYPLKHKFGEPFFRHKVNIVFVASGFDASSKEEWHAHVNRIYNSFEKYSMFSNKVEQLNMFRVDPWNDSSYCALGCLGITRLLCCDHHRALSLAQKCFPVGSNLQTVVIHNDNRYGGGGYVLDNIATVTTHPKASLVAVHELGHSLFDLVDEYSYGPGTDAKPNCDSTPSCDKWSDLIGNTPAGYDRVRCLPGCRNGNFYVGATSFMNDLTSPVGAVNDRFACCTYLALTKSFPSYCDVFDNSTDKSPNYLLNYCKNNDYQGYGSASYDRDPLLSISDGSIQDSSTNYVQVEFPVFVSVHEKIKSSGAAVYRCKKYPGHSGMFPRPRVEGDFSSPRKALKQGEDSVFKVRLIYRTNKQILYFSRNTTIEVPISIDPADRDDEPLVVSEQAGSFNFVADTQGKKLKKVRVTVLDLQKLAQ